ncbi:hypothetical protein NCS56_01083400 [Fusarium sp. Ph1]|nr:hypothetical protein NCS56_01083400 [Fusarium sp. Ph1]
MAAPSAHNTDWAGYWNPCFKKPQYAAASKHAMKLFLTPPKLSPVDGFHHDRHLSVRLFPSSPPHLIQLWRNIVQRMLLAAGGYNMDKAMIHYYRQASTLTV